MALNEADTCRNYILPNLKTVGWEDEYILEQMVPTPGRIVPEENHQPIQGLQQAMQYAEMMG